MSSQRTRDFLAWSARGACAGSGVDFFADGPEAVERAKAVCAACPVIEQCRAWGLLHERFGVWGGIDEAERRVERRRLGLPPPPPLLPERTAPVERPEARSLDALLARLRADEPVAAAAREAAWRKAVAAVAAG